MGESVTVDLRDERVAQAQRQFAGIHRFGEKVGGARFQCAQLGLGVDHRCQNNDRDVLWRPFVAHPRENVESIQRRRHEVEQHDIGLFVEQQVLHAVRIAGRNDVGVAHSPQAGFKAFDIQWLVVDDRDLRVVEHAEVILERVGDAVRRPRTAQRSGRVFPLCDVSSRTELSSAMVFAQPSLPERFGRTQNRRR